MNLCEIFHEYFEYKNGDLFWKVSSSPRVSVGQKIDGPKKPNGYKQVGLRGKLYYLHRITFCMHYGYMPKNVDHIDNDRSNNRIENLREATPQENNRNKTKGVGTTSKYKGVYFARNRGKWRASIQVDGKTLTLGSHITEVEAAKAYNKAALEIFGEFAKINEVYND